LGLLLDELLELDVGCAPHVLARLAAELDADATTILEVVEQLSAEQRHGLRSLPTPLPLVPSIARRFHATELDLRDRELLVALSICLDGVLEALLEFDGRSAAAIAAAPVGLHIRAHAGHVRFADPRLSIWVRATTDAAVIARVHSRLSEIFHRRGDLVDEDWHRARASLEGAPESAVELTSIARQLNAAGHPERALLLAREAAQHAVGAAGDEARLVAGASAVAAGFAAEAVSWFSGLYPHATENRRLRGLGGLFVAQAFEQGVVPEVDPSKLRPCTNDEDEWRQWTRAAGLGALLCAERGDRRGMRLWLDAVREGAGRISAGRELRDPVVALSWLLAGERDIGETTGSGPVTGGLLRALHAAMDGDVDLGLRILARAGSGMFDEVDPVVPGFERSPLVQAYRAVVEVLLLVWRGDLGLARDRLMQTALVLPVSLPFAGLGVVLARRLDLAVLGELGPYARSLTVGLTAGARMDRLVDRGIQAFLAGSFDDAAATIRLWADLGSARTTMTVPALDELALDPEGRSVPAASIEPPEIALAQRLRVRLATAGDGRWRSECIAVREAARTLRSPFARARVETMLGTQHAIRDDHRSARIHLEHAERLFELSGATAWARAIRGRLDRLDAREGSIVPAVDPLAACRAAWSLHLTARELEVAMHAVRGAANRDIAETLNFSVRTVEVHLGRVFTKLDVRSRVELTVLAHRADHHL
jgi:DNA-binding CsgD family transcriptional regulator